MRARKPAALSKAVVLPDPTPAHPVANKPAAAANEDEEDIRSAYFYFHEFELVLVYLRKFLHALISLGYWS